MGLNVVKELLERGGLFAEANFSYKWGVRNKKMLEGLILDEETHPRARPILLSILNSEEFVLNYLGYGFGSNRWNILLKYFTWFTLRNGFSLFVKEYGRENFLYIYGVEETSSRDKSFSYIKKKEQAKASHLKRLALEGVKKDEINWILENISFFDSESLFCQLEMLMGRKPTRKEIKVLIDRFLDEVKETTEKGDILGKRFREYFIGSFLTTVNMDILLSECVSKKWKREMIHCLVSYDWGQKMSINYAMAFAESMGEQLSKHQILTWVRTNDIRKK